VDTTQTITHLGLCAGYGGIELGLHRVIRNLRTVALCEIEAFACANLVAKMEAGLMDAAPIWTDLKSFPWAEFRDRVDILTGGYPCQPFSAAGKRLGTEDPRHLWPFIADGIRILRPRLCFFENVEGHISLGLREVIGELESIGYKAAWGIFSAAEVGAPHQRKRVFILAYDRMQKSYRLSSGLAGNQMASTWERGDEGGIQLADTGHIEPQGWGSATQGQQSGAGRIPRGEPAPCDDQVWPSRPGQPQYAWEPPRVVGHATNKRDFNETEQDHSEAGADTDRASEGAGEDVANSVRSRGEEPEHLNANLPSESSWGDSESVGDSSSERPQERQGQRGSGIQGTHSHGGEDADGQAQSALGGDADGSAGGLGYAELQVTCDNRTDELRLLGNGVVPATAERAFRVLIQELI
jgi:DNA (cytosine-5)-methyltransferase 1